MLGSELPLLYENSRSKKIVYENILVVYFRVIN